MSDGYFRHSRREEIGDGEKLGVCSRKPASKQVGVTDLVAMVTNLESELAAFLERKTQSFLLLRVNKLRFSMKPNLVSALNLPVMHLSHCSASVDLDTHLHLLLS